jgi:hypothetical protein
VWQIPDAVDTVVCAPDDGWKYHPKRVEQIPEINKLCNVASCWIYIGIVLGALPILHISRIRVNHHHMKYGGFQRQCYVINTTAQHLRQHNTYESTALNCPLFPPPPFSKIENSWHYCFILNLSRVLLNV